MLDALSLAVAYPSETLVEAWRSGEFSEILEGALARADTDDGARQACAALAAGIQIYFSVDRQVVDVQADYVGLFDLNRERPPVHLLQHLHDRQTHTTQLELYRQLVELYRSCGITLKQGEGAVPPDQLSVQLEFLAYLCGRLSRAPAGDELTSLRNTQQAFAHTLQWVDEPIERLAQQSPHALYLPLLRVVRRMTEVCGK